MKFTAQRALSLQKSTEARIKRAMEDPKFIVVVKGDDDTVGGRPIKEISEEIKAAYESIRTLISNYNKLKDAQARANVGIVSSDVELKTVTVCGKPYTVEQLLSRLGSNKNDGRKGTIRFEKALLTEMKNQYVRAQLLAQRAETTANDPELINNFITAVTGKADTAKLQPEEVKMYTDQFKKRNMPHLIDPLNLKDTVKELEDYLDKFCTEADAAIQESNALTTFEVDIDE